MANRIGVFVCHCGINIAGTVDIERVKQAIAQYPGVALCTDYKYMCSDPGQNLVRDAIVNEKLDAVVVAACSPTLHEQTFRTVARSAGLNPYLCEISNIREQCSWVHSDKLNATDKAITTVQNIVEKLRLNEPLIPVSVPITRKALVIGAGVSGIQAALDIANSGYEVYLVERQPSIGGHMAQLSETFPTLDCSQCILTPKMVEVSRHPKIHLMTYSEVTDITGFVGNFKVKVRKKARYVIEDKCTACGDCIAVCPVVTPNEFDMGLTSRRAIYIPFPQAVPATFTLDSEACLGLNPLACSRCSQVCGPEAIDYDMRPEEVELDIGAIVIATGYDLYPMLNLGEYGADTIPDVVDGLFFERILSASGPSEGKVVRPSDGKEPKDIVFIQCAGSRDPELHKPYCSKICCMYTTKHAMLYKHRVPDGNAYIFYIDIRTAGKGYEEFYHRALEDDIVYLRGKVSRIFQDGDKVKVWGVDTLTGKKIEIAADMVVLAMAVEPSAGTAELLKMLKVSAGADGFVKEAHAKLRPIESTTAGYFLAGCAQAPRDIPEAVAQASGAASKVAALFSQSELYHEPTTAFVVERLCVGCGRCVNICPYGAPKLDEEKGVAQINEILCEGCGACVATCLGGAIMHRNLNDQQIFEMIRVMAT